MALSLYNEEAGLFRTAYAAGVKKERQDKSKFQREDYYTNNLPTYFELLAAD